MGERVRFLLHQEARFSTFATVISACDEQDARNLRDRGEYLDVHHGRVKYEGLYMWLLLESVFGVLISTLGLAQCRAIDEPTHHIEFAPMYFIRVFFIEIWVSFMSANEIRHMNLSVGHKLADIQGAKGVRRTMLVRMRLSYCAELIGTPGATA